MAIQRRIWLRVKAPQPWRAKTNEELVGTYLGSKIRSGQYGEYRVHFIKSRGLIYYVSGACVDNVFSLITEGMQIKLVFKGVRQVQNTDRSYKLFELYAEEAIEFKLIGGVA